MNKTKKSQSHEEQYSGHSGKLVGKSLPARIHHLAEWQLVSRSTMTNSWPELLAKASKYQSKY